jgi:hypothetical protein
MLFYTRGLGVSTASYSLFCRALASQQELMTVYHLCYLTKRIHHTSSLRYEKNSFHVKITQTVSRVAYYLTPHNVRLTYVLTVPD